MKIFDEKFHVFWLVGAIAIPMVALTFLMIQGSKTAVSSVEGIIRDLRGAKPNVNIYPLPEGVLYDLQPFAVSGVAASRASTVEGITERHMLSIGCLELTDGSVSAVPLAGNGKAIAMYQDAGSEAARKVVAESDVCVTILAGDLPR